MFWSVTPPFFFPAHSVPYWSESWFLLLMIDWLDMDSAGRSLISNRWQGWSGRYHGGRHHFNSGVWPYRWLSGHGRQGRKGSSIWKKRSQSDFLFFNEKEYQANPSVVLASREKKDANINFIPSFNPTNPSLITWNHWRSKKRSTRFDGVNGKTLPISYSPQMVWFWD